MRATSIVVALLVLASCSYPKHDADSHLGWEKTSELAPSLEQARQDCKVSALAETDHVRAGGAAVGGEFVKCMRAAGWTLVER
jgi:hypothetical protein